MSRERISELGVGDIIRPRRSTNRYTVIRFSEPLRGKSRYAPDELMVQLEAEFGRKSLIRSMETITKGWRMVQARD